MTERYIAVIINQKEQVLGLDGRFQASGVKKKLLRATKDRTSHLGSRGGSRCMVLDFWMDVLHNLTVSVLDLWHLHQIHCVCV
jgi:hypothetical protein